MVNHKTRPVKPVNKLVELLLAKMTLHEKVTLLSGRDAWHTHAIERLGIESIVMTDGPHGVRASDAELGRLVGPTTCFPTGVSIGASWNPDLIEKVGQSLGEETIGMGCNVLLGPCINIMRGPLGGRNFETYSEDPYLTGKLGAAYVRGVQSRGVGASVKHFACNNQEIERFRSSSNVDERTLREIYLPAFETIVKEAHPWTVMCSYNRINGIYASQNQFLLKDILKGEWDFDGAVISDWGANHTIVESVQGGLDLEMPGPAKYYGNLLEEAVMNWQLDESDLDDAVRRVLRLIIRAGKLGKGNIGKSGSVNTSEHQDLARQLAEESIVLLKNEGHILPLDVSKIRSIAIIGPNATEGRIGGGGSSYAIPPYRVSPLQALQDRLAGRVKIVYAKGCDNNVETSNSSYVTHAENGIGFAVAAVKECDLALIFAGMPEYYETEGWDRPDMELPGKQNELIERVVEANPNTVVIINAGAPVRLPWQDSVRAILEAFYPGMEGGNAMARILLGDVNPSGKLPVTFPMKLEDSPAYINPAYPGVRDINYGEGLFIGYRYYDKRGVRPAYPFGHGLSYTQFEIGPVSVAETIKRGTTVDVRVRIKNVGDLAGKEVIQLYVKDTESSIPRPVKELKGFQKVCLQPGEEQEVHFQLTPRDLSFYDPYRKAWVTEAGEFELQIGVSALDIRSEVGFTLE